MADKLGFEEFFYDRLLENEPVGGYRSEDLLAMMCSESGLRHDIRNKIGAAGLTQLLPQTQRNLGYNEAVSGPFEKRPAHEQIMYTVRYYAWWRRHFSIERFRSRGHLYQCNFMPATLEGKYDEEEVVLDRLKWSKAYAQNKTLDINKDGLITVAELSTHIDVSVKLCQDRYDCALEGVKRARERAGVEVETVKDKVKDVGKPIRVFPNIETVDGLQTALNQLKASDKKPYFDHAVTGFYGPITREAVRKFQRDHGCKVDGWSGKETRAALWKALTA